MAIGLIDRIWMDSLKVWVIKDSFENLKLEQDELKRRVIIEELITREDIKMILQGLTNISNDALVNNVSISWAWMVKVKLFSSIHGSLRYHIFSPKFEENDLSIMQFDDNPHIHWFQAYSHVVHWNIIENTFNLVKLNEHEDVIYQNFLTSFGEINQAAQQWIVNLFKNKEYNLANEEVFWQLLPKYKNYYRQIRNFYTIFDSIKGFDATGDLVEKFFNVWTGSFTPIMQRKIKKWEHYHLSAETAHTIAKGEDDTITVFLTDDTFESMWFKKNKDTFLRGHGQQFPHLQPDQCIRKQSESKVNKWIIEIIKDVTQNALESMR